MPDKSTSRLARGPRSWWILVAMRTSRFPGPKLFRPRASTLGLCAALALPSGLAAQESGLLDCPASSPSESSR